MQDFRLSALIARAERATQRRELAALRSVQRDRTPQRLHAADLRALGVRWARDEGGSVPLDVALLCAPFLWLLAWLCARFAALLDTPTAWTRRAERERARMRYEWAKRNRVQAQHLTQWRDARQRRAARLF